jgi:hypothetical protein
MSTAKAIQVSITYVSLGIMLGATLEAFMPPFAASSSTAAIVFEAFVQVGLNGVLLAQVGRLLTADDPTFGLPFSWGLFEAQPALCQRIVLLAGIARRQVFQIALKMEPLVPEVVPTNPHS